MPPLLRFPANASYVLLFNLKLQKTGIKSVLWVYTIRLMIEFGKRKFLKYPSSLLYSHQTDLIQRRMIEKIQGIYGRQVIQICCWVNINLLVFLCAMRILCWVKDFHIFISALILYSNLVSSYQTGYPESVSINFIISCKLLSNPALVSIPINHWSTCLQFQACHSV